MPDVHRLTAKEIAGLQREYNAWTKHYLRGKTPLIVDGIRGTLFCRRTEAIKYYLGSGKDRDCDINLSFLNRLRHTRERQYFTRTLFAVASARRVRQRAAYRAGRAAAAITPGVTTFDGVPVAKPAVRYLQWARDHGWQGKLVSGWRSIPYSISLCFRICGRAFCPGRCAGASTNHVGKTIARFAVDVSDYARFGQIISRCPYSPRIYNALGARDPVHFSPSGR